MLLTGASSIGASPSSIPTSPLLNANFIKNGIANAVNGGVTLPKELLVAILSHLVGSSDNSTTGQESLTSGRQPPISYGYPERKVCVCRCSCGKRPARDAETNTNPLDLLNFSGIADLMSSPVYSNHFGSSGTRFIKSEF